MTASIGAMRYVIETLQNVLPPGTPTSWLKINAACWVGTGKHRRARADLTMFDGKPATVEAWESKGLRAHRWVEMPGGDCSFEDGRWMRIDRETLEPVAHG